MRFRLRTLLVLVALIPITIGAGYSVWAGTVALQVMLGTWECIPHFGWISREYGTLAFVFVVGVIGRIVNVFFLGGITFGLAQSRHRPLHLFALVLTAGLVVADIAIQWQASGVTGVIFGDSTFTTLEQPAADSAAALIVGTFTFVPLWLGLQIRGFGAYKTEQQARSSKVISFIVYILLIFLAIAGFAIAADPYGLKV